MVFPAQSVINNFLKSFIFKTDRVGNVSKLGSAYIISKTIFQLVNKHPVNCNYFNKFSVCFKSQDNMMNYKITFQIMLEHSPVYILQVTYFLQIMTEFDNNLSTHKCADYYMRLTFQSSTTYKSF